MSWVSVITVWEGLSEPFWQRGLSPKIHPKPYLVWSLQEGEGPGGQLPGPLQMAEQNCCSTGARWQSPRGWYVDAARAEGCVVPVPLLKAVGAVCKPDRWERRAARLPPAKQECCSPVSAGGPPSACPQSLESGNYQMIPSISGSKAVNVFHGLANCTLAFYSRVLVQLPLCSLNESVYFAGNELRHRVCHLQCLYTKSVAKQWSELRYQVQS